jgi:lipoprotein-anchoring transpeptidase ErfK/SrfK
MRRTLAVAAALLAGLAGCGGEDEPRAPLRPAAEAPTPTERPGRDLPPADLGAQIERRTALRDAPDGDAVERVGPKSRWGGPAILAVVERRGPWVAVLHHAMPNDKPGWVAVEDVKLVREPWAIEVDLSEREAVVRLHDKAVDRIPVAIGRPASPTPTGRFGVTDRLVTKPGSPYGCCILALSGTQPNVPEGWPGGNRIAIHGTSNEASVGSPASAGCLRMRDADIRKLMRRIPVGARVEIKA